MELSVLKKKKTEDEKCFVRKIVIKWQSETIAFVVIKGQDNNIQLAIKQNILCRFVLSWKCIRDQSNQDYFIHHLTKFIARKQLKVFAYVKIENIVFLRHLYSGM